MIKALVMFNEDEDQLLNLMKAKYRLRNKNDALRLFLKKYGENELEPELRPEYLRKIRKIEKEGYGKTFNSIEELRKNLRIK